MGDMACRKEHLDLVLSGKLLVQKPEKGNFSIEVCFSFSRSYHCGFCAVCFVKQPVSFLCFTEFLEQLVNKDSCCHRAPVL